MSPASLETRATTIGKWLLAVTIPFSALAVGSVPAPALVVVSTLAAIACGLLWLSNDAPVSRASRLVILGVLVLVLFTGLQALPLPASMARVLSPSSADIWDRALTPLYEAGPSVHPLSVAPGATHIELLRGLFYACVFLGALRVAALREGERFLSRLVVASAVLMALAALGHSALGAEKVFGIYRPREIWAYAPNHYAPLLNTNHLAAYLDIGCVRRARCAPLAPSDAACALGERGVDPVGDEHLAGLSRRGWRSRFRGAPHLRPRRLLEAPHG